MVVPPAGSVEPMLRSSGSTVIASGSAFATTTSSSILSFMSKPVSILQVVSESEAAAMKATAIPLVPRDLETLMITSPFHPNAFPAAARVPFTGNSPAP